MKAAPDPNIVAGFNRQRRSLLIISLVLFGFQGIDPQLKSLTIFGNIITLSTPLDVIAPLWVGWCYFLVRYYQYLRDLGDKGIHAAYRNRLINLANVLARRSAHKYLPLNTEGLAPHPRVQLNVKDVYLVAHQPPPWEYEIIGAIHIDERPPGTKGRIQMLEKEHFRLPASQLVIPHLRAGWWVIAHTRLTTEYALPLVVATLPVLRTILAIGE